MMFWRRAVPEWFSNFVAEVEAFGQSLPDDVRWTFAREWDGGFLFSIKPPTKAHRALSLGGSIGGLEYELGRVWTENLKPEPTVVNRLLAVCDAVKLGRVREVRDRQTGILYHVYRLKTRGEDTFIKDAQYSCWSWLGVRKVQIHRLPPLLQVR